MPSSVIRWMRYDPTRRELTVRFRAQRELYVYMGVPLEEWTAFRAAASKGTYLNQVFKAKEFRFRRLEAGEVAPAVGDEMLFWGEPV